MTISRWRRLLFDIMLRPTCTIWQRSRLAPLAKPKALQEVAGWALPD